MSDLHPYEPDHPQCTGPFTDVRDCPVHRPLTEIHARALAKGFDQLQARHAALVAALEALEQNLRVVRGVDSAASAADRAMIADRIAAILRQHREGLTPIAPEEP